MLHPSRRWFRCSLAVACAMSFFALVVWGIREANKAAYRQNRANSLRQIGLGILNFDSVYKRLPEPVRYDEQGNKLSSWRFQISAFMESLMRELDYSTAWDSPVNHWLTSRPHPSFCFHSDSMGPDSLYANVVLVTGPGTAFDGEQAHTKSSIDDDQIIAIEVANSGVSWAAPGDISIDEVSPKILQGTDGEGVYVLFADARVAYVPADASLDVVRNFLTVQGAKANDREDFVGTTFEMGPWR